MNWIQDAHQQRLAQPRRALDQNVSFGEERCQHAPNQPSLAYEDLVGFGENTVGPIRDFSTLGLVDRLDARDRRVRFPFGGFGVFVDEYDLIHSEHSCVETTARPEPRQRGELWEGVA